MIVLDTVKVSSPYLDDAVVRAVKLQCEQKGKRNNVTGEWLWTFAEVGLFGSWDHRIVAQLLDFEYRVQQEPIVLHGPTKDGRVLMKYVSRTKKVSCRPYLVIEGSVHKLLLGHNVFGGPEDIVAPIRWLIGQAALQLGVELPCADVWRVRRLDWAEVYDLGSFEAVDEFVGLLRNAEFPRRKVGRYGQESLNITGDMTGVKIYHKGPEFEKHDRPRLKRSSAPVVELQHRANMLLRCEVELRARALDELFGPEPVVGTLCLPETLQRLIELYDHNMGKVLREGDISMEIVRTAVGVRRRLYERYTPVQAYALYGTWLGLSALGEAHIKEAFAARRRTFYDHRKKLVESGCSWHGGDVKLDQSVRLVPDGFSPRRSDPRRLVGEAPEVSAQLVAYRQAG